MPSMMNSNTLDHRTNSDFTEGTWKLREDGVSPIVDDANNQAIEAYQKGKADGHIEGKQEGQLSVQRLLGRLNDIQMSASAALAHQALTLLKEHGYRYHEVHLRTRGMSVYEMLIEVDERAYVSDEFLKVVALVARLEQDARNDTFYPMINFISIDFDDDNRINYQALIGDGFIYRLDYSPST